MAKFFYRYLLCFILGILLYLVLGNKNGFSVSGAHGDPCTRVFDREKNKYEYKGCNEEVGEVCSVTIDGSYKCFDPAIVTEQEEIVLREITYNEIHILQGENIDAKKQLNLKYRDFKDKLLEGPAGTGVPRTGNQSAARLRTWVPPRMRESDKFYANLVGLNFSGSDFSRIAGKDTVLSYLDFSGADLRNTNFSGHISMQFASPFDLDTDQMPDLDIDPGLENIKFVEAKLNRSNFSTNGMKNCDFSNASLAMANFSNTKIDHRSKFPGISAPDINFSNSHIEGEMHAGNVRKHLDFTKAYLINADFTGANLVAVDFTRANLRMADFRNARLANIKFDNADLTGANFQGAILDSNIFSNATLTLARLVDIIDIDSKVLSQPRHRDQARDGLTKLARQSDRDTEPIIRNLQNIRLSLAVFTYSSPELDFANKLGNLMLRSGLFLQDASDEWKPDDKGKYPNEEGYNGDIDIEEIGPEGAGAEKEFNEILMDDTTTDEGKSTKLRELAVGKYKLFNSIIEFLKFFSLKLSGRDEEDIVGVNDNDLELLDMMKKIKIKKKNI